MKSNKRLSIKFIVSIMITILFLSTLNTLAATKITFKDTTESDWFSDSLDTLYRSKIITGFPDGTFRGEQTLQYDEIIALLCRANNSGITNGPSYWAQPYIDYAKTKGWLEGLSISNYQKPISRQEACKLIIQSTQVTLPDNLSAYTVYLNDHVSLPQQFSDDILLNIAYGFITGFPDGTFRGESYITRAETTAVIHRVIDVNERRTPLDPSTTASLISLFDAPDFNSYTEFDKELDFYNGRFQYHDSQTDVDKTINQSQLETPIGIISEESLADAIIYMSESDSTNELSAGYDYNLYTINLLTEDNESILIYSATDNSMTINIDLVIMADEFGVIRPDALEMLSLLTQSISQTYGSQLYDFILTQYNNRSNIPLTGVAIDYGTISVLLKSVVQDNSVINVAITLSDIFQE